MTQVWSFALFIRKASQWRALIGSPQWNTSLHLGANRQSLQVLLPRQSRKAELLFKKKKKILVQREDFALQDLKQTCMFKNSKMLLFPKCVTVSFTSGKQQYTTSVCRTVVQCTLCFVGKSTAQWLKCIQFSLCKFLSNAIISFLISHESKVLLLSTLETVWLVIK